MKVVYMGTPEFAVLPLERISGRFEVGYAVTSQDKPRNRGKKLQFTPVKDKAIELGIEVLQPDKIKGNTEFINTLREYDPDVIFVAAYGKLLPKEILELPRFGCINIHASLLPRHRGAAPIQNSILMGDEKTGVTIMRMAEGLDTGNMILKAETETANKTSGMLHDELSVIGSELVVEVLDAMERGETINEEVQDESLSCYAPMIFKKDGEIDFTLSAEEIERKTRAFDPWPGAYTYLGEEQFKIWEADVIGEETDAAPGTVLSSDASGIRIAAGKGIISARIIQVPGRKRTPVSEYIKGNSIAAGTVLGKEN